VWYISGNNGNLSGFANPLLVVNLKKKPAFQHGRCLLVRMMVQRKFRPRRDPKISNGAVFRVDKVPSYTRKDFL
jgi:hypothetical protein